MKEHPLLLSTQMVQAYLAKHKHCTRRIPGPMNSLVDGKRVSGKRWKELDFDLKEYHIRDNMFFLMSKKEMKYYRVEPIYQPGDLLYFRENWSIVEREGHGIDKQFLVFETEWKGNEVVESAPLRSLDKFHKWGGHPSIHLPKEVTRLWAEVTDCKCEHVQDITEEQAIAEGIEYVVSEMCPGYKDYTKLPKSILVSVLDNPIQSFQSLWASINGGDSWSANPPVYAISYKILSTTGRPLEKEKQS